MTSSLQIKIGHDAEVAVMYLTGRIDIDSSPYLRDELHALLRRKSPPTSVAVDLGAAVYMDASGIATLVEALKIARIGHIAMYLQGLRGRLLYLLHSTGISSLFDTNESESHSSATKVS